MRMEKCEKLMSRFLKGERSEAIVEHFQECAECRKLAALNRMLSGKPERMAVPEELDRKILQYAAAKKRPAVKVWDIAFILRHAAIPAAAAAMVCIGLVFAYRPSVNPPHQALVRAQTMQYDLDSVDSEVLLLSSRIRNTSAQLSRTAVYNVIDE